MKLYPRSSLKKISLAVGIGIMAAFSSASLADGDEYLGPVVSADVQTALMNGNRIRIAGTGLHDEQEVPNIPNEISFTLNPGETVERVLLYWQVFDDDLAYDTDIDVSRNGGTDMMVSGEVIGEFVSTLGGSPAPSFYGAYSATIRADVTDMNLIQTGSNTLTIDGLNLIALPNANFGDDGKNGAGILVILSDGSSTEVQLADGHDAAWWQRSGTLGSTVPVVFNFAPSASERMASMSMFVASVEGAQAGNDRPNIIRFTSGGVVTEVYDQLTSNRGFEWDDYQNDAVVIPASADSLQVEILSAAEGGGPYSSDGGVDPASFVWLTAGLTIQPEAMDACPDGQRPKVLTFRYLGGSCAMSDNQQTDFKCQGDLDGTPDVMLKYTDKFNGNKAQWAAKIQGANNDGYVSLMPNESFTLYTDSSNRLPPQTQFVIKAEQSMQWLDIHTSCSQPLNIGDRYGSLELIGFETRDFGPSNNQGGGKP
ncbi:DUF7467 domain-containing protein [Paraferrimonas sedimenticola]|uniref:DUF7467 domain-containing protein n=1 Tax=Paraferrimonas sedimenticola TaxID=375674 RepID=A0AA37W1F6_9GAMM|nr:hypothetical protein [Paraferrimonas sedimenticola]GLP97405.1 hypothetical protein GCM10007895_27120 [Paraferrimonas sedimenticola]